MCVALNIAAQESLIVSSGNIEAESLLKYTGDKTGVGYATKFTNFKMLAYKNCQLKSISIHLNGACEGRVFATTSLTSTTTKPLAEKTFKASGFELAGGGSGWYEVVFDEPITLSNKTMYFGYEITSTAPARSVSYTTVLTSGTTEYYNDGTGWKIVNGETGMMFFTVTGSVPQNEICLNNVSMPDISLTGNTIMPTAEVVNLGKATVKSLEVTYTIGESTQTKTIEGLNIPTRSVALVKLPALQFDKEGDYGVVTNISLVNGEKDSAPIDNASNTKTIYVRTTLPEHNMLLEVFSTERCTACPEGHALIEKVMKDKTNVIELGHHAGFYTDQFTIPASSAYEWFYKTADYTTSYAPATMLDRTSFKSAYPSVYSMSAPLFDPTEQRLNTAYNTQSEVPGLADINIDASYDAATRELSVSVSAEVFMLLPQHLNPTLNVFLTEDSVFSTTQVNSDGKFYHRHMARACLTPTWGDALTNKKLSRVYIYKVEPEWDMSRMEVVAFVANYDKNDNTNCNVLNAAKADLKPLVVDGIATVSGEATVVRRTYTSLSGVTTLQPQPGINIVREYLSNGEVRVRKK